MYVSEYFSKLVGLGSFNYAFILPLVGLSDIKNSCIWLNYVFNEIRSRERQVLVLPVLNGETSVTLDIDVSDSKQSGDWVLSFISRAIDHKSLWRTEESSNPVGKSSIEADADTIFDYTFLKFFRFSDVQQNHVLFFQERTDLVNAEMFLTIFRCFFMEERLELV